jgi:hypothetical protein
MTLKFTREISVDPAQSCCGQIGGEIVRRSVAFTSLPSFNHVEVSFQEYRFVEALHRSFPTSYSHCACALGIPEQRPMAAAIRYGARYQIFVVSLCLETVWQFSGKSQLPCFSCSFPSFLHITLLSISMRESSITCRQFRFYFY